MPSPTDNFGIDRKEQLKHIFQIRVGLSPLNKHKYLHNFENCNLGLCKELDGVEDPFHFFFECKKYIPERKMLFFTIFKATDINLLTYKRDKLDLLLFGNISLKREQNKKVLLATSKYITDTGRFSTI